jgi:hypothetical protein
MSIPIGTELQPCDPAAAAIRVVGLAGENYVVTAAAGFGPNWSLAYDAITAGFDCSGYDVQIRAESELEQWAKLSAEQYRPVVRPPAEPELTPEQQFSLAAAEADAT